MEGFNSVFASAIDDENTYDSIFGDDAEDILINMVAQKELYTESGDEIEYPDMIDDEDEEECPEDDCDDSSIDNLDKDSEEDGSVSTSDFEDQLFGGSEEEPSTDDIDPATTNTIDSIEDNDDEDETSVPATMSTRELDRKILFDGGDVGDSGEEQYEGDEAENESTLLESKKSKKTTSMKTADLDAVINGISDLKSSNLEAPDEDLIDDVESDDIDAIGESLNLLI